jgi:predicted acylesterase/phospholipase RssA
MIKKILLITVLAVWHAQCATSFECLELPTIHYDYPNQGVDGSFYVEHPRGLKLSHKIVQGLEEQKELLQRPPYPGQPDSERIKDQERLKEINKELQKPIYTKRILSCSGGGSKGLISATVLAYLEEVINAPENQKQKDKILQQIGRDVSKDSWLYLSDIFDIGAGTSTGSVLTASYFYDGVKRYRAVDAARVYLHHSADIFGTKNALGSTSISSKYSHIPYQALLKAFTGNQVLNNPISNKRVYIYGVSGNQIICFKSYSCPQIVSPQNPYKLENTPLWQAVRASSAAPTFFDHEPITMNDGSTLPVTDGGTSLNCPAWVTVQKEIQRAQVEKERTDIEIFSFGTGNEQHQATETSIAVIHGFNVLLTATAISESRDLESCRIATQSENHPVTFCAHINPLLEMGMKLDSTDENFMAKALKCGIEATKGASFKAMVEQLGFVMPDESLEKAIIEKIHAIEINILRQESSRRQQLLKYLTRKLRAYDYNLFLRGKVSIIEGGNDPVVWEGTEFTTFLQKIKPLIQNDSQGDEIIDLLIRSQEKIKEIPPLTAEIWALMRNKDNLEIAKGYFKDHTKKFTQTKPPKSSDLSLRNGANTTLVAKASQDSSTHPLPEVVIKVETTTGTVRTTTTVSMQMPNSPPPEESDSTWDELTFEERSALNSTSTLMRFYDNYIKFLNELEATDTSSKHAPALTQIYLNAAIGNADFFSLDDLSHLQAVTKSLIDELNTTKGQLGFICQTRFNLLLTAIKEKIQAYIPIDGK